MDLIEFSIACKLISLKLRNVEVPKLLPPTLIASLKHIGTPIRTPTGSMSPVEGYKQFLPPVSNVPIQQPVMIAQQQQQFQPILHNEPVVMHPQAQIMMSQQIQQQQQQQLPMMVTHNSQGMGIQAIPSEMITQQQMMMPQAQMIVQPQPQVVPMSSTIPMIPIGAVLPTTQPLIMAGNMQNTSAPVAQPSRPSLTDHSSSGSLLDSLNQAQHSAIVPGSLPAAPTPTPPQSGHASRSMSFSEKAPSIPESP